MGTLTDDMVRLRAEIDSLRQGRRALQHELANGIHELRQEVAGLREGFRAAHAEMAGAGRRTRLHYVMDLNRQVGELLGAVAADLEGARQAWLGFAVTGRGDQARHQVPIERVETPAAKAAVLGEDATPSAEAPYGELAMETATIEDSVSVEVAALSSLDCPPVEVDAEHGASPRRKSGSKQKRRPGARTK